MSLPEVALIVGVSAVTSVLVTLLVTLRGDIRYLFVRAPRPRTNKVLEEMIRVSNLANAASSGRPTGTPPSAPPPPVE